MIAQTAVFKARLLTIALATSLAVAAFAAPPVLFYSDLDSGPNTGGENNNGVYVTLYGNFLTGATATVGGSTVAIKSAPSAWLWYQRMTIQLGASAATGNIVVTTANGASNAIPFTVRAGNIYCVSTAGLDANSGLLTAAQTTCWRTIQHASDVMLAGDTAYVLNGIVETVAGTNGSVSIGGNVYHTGTAGNPIAFVGYPGATATIGATGTALCSAACTEGLLTFANNNLYSYFTVANLQLKGNNNALLMTGNTAVYSPRSSNWRVIGNDITCPFGSGTTGCASWGQTDQVSFYGNNVHDVGGQNTQTGYHAVYPTTDSNHQFIAWNKIDNHVGGYGVHFHSSPDNGGTPTDPTGKQQFDLHVHDNTISNTQLSGIIFATVDPSSGVVEAYNNVIFHGGKGPAVTGAGSYACIDFPGLIGNSNMPVGSGTADVYNNTLYDCGGAMPLAVPALGPGWGGVYLSSPASNVEPLLRVRIRNNIGYQPTVGEFYWSMFNLAGDCATTCNNLFGTNNLFFGRGNPGPDSELTNPNVTVSTVSDPLFVSAGTNDFHLNTGSPAATMGVNTTLVYDHDGQPIVTFSAGAFTSASRSITVLSPADGSTQGPSLASIPLTVSITGAPTTERVDYFIGGKYYGTSRLVNGSCDGLVCPSGNFSSTLYPFAGDTTTNIQAVAKDVYGVTLATSALNTFTVKNNGAELSLSSLPVGNWVGDVTYTVVSNFSPHGPSHFVDGRPVLSVDDGYGITGGGGASATIHTAHFRNGLHEVYVGMSATAQAGMLSFAPTAVNTTTSVITLNGNTCANCSSPNHPFLTGQAVVLSTTGTAPGGLTAGTTYFAARISATTIKVAASSANATTCAASSTNCITLTTQGTGTHTWSFNLAASLFYDQGGCPSCFFQNFYSYAKQTYDFENGNAAMELRSLQDVYLYQDGATTASVAPSIENCDGSITTIAATAPVYTIANTAVATVSASGVVTAVAPGYTSGTISYLTLPVATFYVTVKAVTNFPHFTKSGQIISTYTPGSSTFMTSEFSMGDAGQAEPALCPEYNWGGLTVTEMNPGFTVANPSTVSYASGRTQWLNAWNPEQTEATNCNHGFFLLMESWSQPNSLPYIYNNTANISPNDLSLAQSIIADISNDARCVGGQWKDEGSVYYSCNTSPSAVVGSAAFTSIVVSGATMTVNYNGCRLTPYSNTTADSSWVKVTAATTAGLNGPYKVTATTENANPNIAAQTISFIVPNTNNVANGTYNAVNNAGMTLLVGFGPLQIYGGQCCVLPGKAATYNPSALAVALNQNWDANFTQISVTANLATVTWTNCCIPTSGDGLATGDIVRFWNVTHTELNNVFPITRVSNNSFTFPITTANFTYNSTTDPALVLNRDCRMTGNELANIKAQIFNVPNAFAFGANIVGPSLADPPEFWWIPNWLNNSSFGAFASLYANPGTSDYDGTLSLSELTKGYSYATLSRGTWGQPAIAGTISVQPIDYVKNSKDTHFVPGTDKIQGHLSVSTNYVPMQIWYTVMIANAVGNRNYTYEAGSTLTNAYNAATGTNYTQGHNPFTTWTGHWAAQSFAWTTIQKLLKYILQPPISAPYYGVYFVTGARQVVGNTGRLLMVMNISETPRSQAVDFTNYRYAGGLIRRYRVTAAGATVASLASSSTSDSPIFSKGEAILYVFQPIGSSPETTTVRFSAPSLPTGTDGLAVRTNFYHAMNVDAINCTAGCSLEMDLGATDMWFQNIYTLAGVPKNFGDAQKLKHK